VIPVTVLIFEVYDSGLRREVWEFSFSSRHCPFKWTLLKAAVVMVRGVATVCEERGGWESHFPLENCPFKRALLTVKLHC
jgi:hypothetical protein